MNYLGNLTPKLHSYSDFLSSQDALSAVFRFDA